MKQHLLFLSFNYPQRAVYIVYIKQTLLFLDVQLSSTRGLAIVYIKQPLFVQFLNAPFSHCLYLASNLCHCFKQPLLFLSFNYPQRDVWPLFIWSNLCCFYRSIILNAPFGHCLYEATFVVDVLSFIVLSSTLPFGHCLYEATFVVFIVQLSSTRRLGHCLYQATLEVFIVQLSVNTPFTLFTLSNLCCFYRSIILNAPFEPLIILSNLCCFYRSIIPQRAV